MKTTLSHSEIDEYLSCRRKHYYKYGLRLNKTGSSDALRRGILGHSALEAIFKKAREEYRPICSDDFATGNAVLAAHLTENMQDLDMVNHLLKALKVFSNSISEFENFIILGVEEKYEVDLGESEISLVIDLVVTDNRDGSYGIIDHKFVGSAYYGDQTSLMPQLPRYAAALDVLGLPHDWFAYNQFVMTATPKRVFEYVEVSQPRVERVGEEHALVSKEIMRLRTLDLAEWSYEATRVGSNLICNHCPMKALCIAELNGQTSKAQQIMDADFKVRD